MIIFVYDAEYAMSPQYFKETVFTKNRDQNLERIERTTRVSAGLTFVLSAVFVSLGGFFHRFIEDITVDDPWIIRLSFSGFLLALAVVVFLIKRPAVYRAFTGYSLKAFHLAMGVFAHILIVWNDFAHSYVLGSLVVTIAVALSARDKKFLFIYLLATSAEVLAAKLFYSGKPLLNPWLYAGAHWALLLSMVYVAFRRIFLYAEIRDREYILRAVNERMNRIIELSPSAILILDTEGIVRYWSRGAEKMFGYKNREVMHSKLPFVPDDQWADFMRRHKDFINGRTESRLEISRKNKYGEDIYLIADRAVLTDENRQVTGVLAIVTDITERHSAEIILAEAKKEAERANKAKSEFLARMSHEIRTPLNGILPLLDLLDRNSDRADKTEIIDTIHKSSLMMKEIVDDILDLSRVESGRLTIEKKSGYLCEIAEHCRDMYLVAAEQQGVELKIECNSDRPVLIDAFRLKQVLNNLVSNAVKFTDRGEIVLSIETLEKTDSETARVRFAVTDSGPGIPEEVQSTIMEPFIQAKLLSEPEVRGSGLGLSISRELVRLMGGRLELKSPVAYDSDRGKGYGTSFFFELDVKETDSSDSDESVETSENSLKGIKALIVDDSPVNLMVLRRSLESLNVQVTALQHSRDVIAAVEAEDFDIILLDLEMPEISGIELAEKLSDKGIPLVAVTAHLLDDKKDDCLRAGFQQVLIKPFQISELFSVVSDSLREKSR